LPAADELRRIPVESPPPLTEGEASQDDSNDEAVGAGSEEASDLANDTFGDSADSGHDIEDTQSEHPDDDEEADDDEEEFVDDEDEFEDDDDWELDDSDDHDEADETEHGEDEETSEDELGDEETNLDNQHPEKEES